MHSRWAISQACRVLAAGGVISQPTEAVFGLSCDPLNRSAVQKLIDIKGRPHNKGFILIAANITQLLPYIDVASADLNKIATVGGRARTWIVTAAPGLPATLCGPDHSIAIRISQHPICQALCLRFARPIISSSANLSGHTAAGSNVQVRLSLGKQLDYQLGGPLGNDPRPSEIIRLSDGVILRS